MAKQEINFGRRFKPDARDKGFMMARLLKAVPVLSVSKTWRISAKALDQGDTGTCVAQAWANFLRAAPIQTAAGIDQLRWDIYDKAILLDEWPDNDADTERQLGTTVRGGAEAVRGMGRLKSYVWAFSLQPVIEWVLLRGPVVLGTNWYSSMMRPDAAGLVSIKPSASLLGGHAYLLRGMDTRHALALCSNSWGDDWGKSGEFRMSFRDLERLITEDGEACAAVESRLVAKVMM